MPAGGRAWKLQSLCQFSANSGGGLVGLALDRDDMGAAGDRRDEGIMAETAERDGEAFEIVIAHLLVREGEHVMLEPGRADVSDVLRCEGL